MGLTVCTSRPNIIQNGHRRKNTCFCCMRTTQAQTSLHIHTVCSATYIFAIGIFGNLKEPSTPATRNVSRLELVSIAEQFINLCLASLRQYTLSGLNRPAGETPPSLAGRWWPTLDVYYAHSVGAAQTRLRICIVLSATLLFTYWKVSYLNLLLAKFHFSELCL